MYRGIWRACDYTLISMYPGLNLTENAIYWTVMTNNVTNLPLSTCYIHPANNEILQDIWWQNYKVSTHHHTSYTLYSTQHPTHAHTVLWLMHAASQTRTPDQLHGNCTPGEVGRATYFRDKTHSKTNKTDLRYDAPSLPAKERETIQHVT